jgi:hypothetical protein
MPGEPQPKEPVFLVRPGELKDPAARKKFVTSMTDDLVAMINAKRKANGLGPVGD